MPLRTVIPNKHETKCRTAEPKTKARYPPESSVVNKNERGAGRTGAAVKSMKSPVTTSFERMLGAGMLEEIAFSVFVWRNAFAVVVY